MRENFVVELSSILSDFEEGNYEHALERLKEFNNSSTDFSEKIEFARIYINLGLVEDANKILDNLEKTHSENTEINRVRAELFFYEGENEKALSVLYDINDEEYSCDDYELLSQIYFKEGLPEVAYKYISKAITENSDEPSYYYHKGVYAYEIGDVSIAREDLEKAISLDKNEPMYYLALGEILYNLGKFEESLSLYDKVLELDSEQEDALYLKGLLLLSLEKVEDSIISLKKALNKNQDNIEVLEALSMAYEQNNDQLGNINILNQILMIDEYNISALKKLADIYIRNNDLLNAREIIYKGLEADPQDEALVFMQNRIMELEGEI